MARLTLDGYDVEELIGVGGTGEVWQARVVATGDLVALKRLRVPGPTSIQRLRREAAMLAAVAGPGVVAVRDVVARGDEAVMVLDLAPGGSLAAVLAARGRISPAELVTVLAPVAGALAAAHDKGLVHGDVSPANVLFTEDGRPLLSDFGVAHAAGAAPSVVEGTAAFLDPAVVAGADPSPASDVWSLAALGVVSLTGRPPSLLPRDPVPPDPLADVPHGMREALLAALADDPADRPTARELAREVLLACAAAPVRLVPLLGPLPAPPTAPVHRPEVPPGPYDPPALDVPDGTGGGPGLRTRLAVGSAAAAALVVAAAAGVAWAHSGRSGAAALATAPPTAAPPTTAPPMTAAPPPTAPPPAAPRTTAPPRWLAVVRRLDATRAGAFDTADASLLDQVYAPGVPALRADRRTVADLARRGLHARGFAATVVAAHPVQVTERSATVRVTDRLSGYELVDARGRRVTTGPARGRRPFLLTVVRTAAGWRISRLAAS